MTAGGDDRLRMVAPTALRLGDSLRDPAAGNIAELAESIRTFGVLEPVLVTEDAEGQLTVLAGQRRVTAAMEAGQESIPALVIPFAGVNRLEVALVENLQREELSPLEEARAYEKLIEAGRTTRQIGARVGRAHSHVVKRLSLLELVHEVQEVLETGGISVTQALEIAKLPAPLQGRIFEPRFDSMTAAQAVQVIAREAGEHPNGQEPAAAEALAGALPRNEPDAAPGPATRSARRVEALAASPAAFSEEDLREATRKVLDAGIPWDVRDRASAELFTAEEALAAGGRMQAYSALVVRANGVELGRMMIAVAKVLP